MTPEREAYWKKCSLKERTLRALINDEKCAIKVLKNNFKYPENYNFNILLIMISQCKVRLSAYRHELQRLKGMDNVVVPRQVRMVAYPASHGFGFGYECVAIGLCACGAPLRDDECKYCQRCGKTQCARA